jgi:hypothetical protein
MSGMVEALVEIHGGASETFQAMFERQGAARCPWHCSLHSVVDVLFVGPKMERKSGGDTYAGLGGDKVEAQ